MNTQVTPPVAPVLHANSMDDLLLLKLSREIAMDIRPLQDILDTHGVTSQRWAEIAVMPRFQQYLRSSVEEWSSAANTSERVRLKSLAIVEEVLPEFYARMHDARETLSAKTEVLKSIAKFGGVGVVANDGIDPGSRMTVTINLGSDQQVRIDKEVTPRGNPTLNYDLDAEIAEEFEEVSGESAEEEIEFDWSQTFDPEDTL